MATQPEGYLASLEKLQHKVEAAEAEARQALADRNAALLAGRQTGYTVRDLAAASGLSPIRVHQLTGGAGVGPRARKAKP